MKNDYFKGLYGDAQNYKMNHTYDAIRNKALMESIRKFRCNTSSVILDVGIGSNLFIKRFKGSLYGVDVSPFFARLQKKNGVTCWVGDLNKGLPKQALKVKYDIILCTEVLEHLLDGRQLLTDMKNCLSKDGILIITIPCDTTFYANRIKLFFSGDIYGTDVNIYEQQHVRFFTYPMMKRCLKEAGFKVVYKTAYNQTVRNSINGFLFAPPFKNVWARLFPSWFATNHLMVVK
jgi:SAM-dependent methyltransferase